MTKKDIKLNSFRFHDGHFREFCHSLDDLFGLRELCRSLDDLRSQVEEVCSEPDIGQVLAEVASQHVPLDNLALDLKC
jgi:hypothetical protein